MNYKAMATLAKKQGVAKDLTPLFFQFKNPGDSVVGLMKGWTPTKSTLGGGDYNQYLVETDEGLVKFALGEATDKELSASIERGKIYAITFEGQVKGKQGRTINKFKVVELDPTLVSEEPSVPDEPPSKQRKG
jgi:hypothetical protein